MTIASKQWPYGWSSPTCSRYQPSRVPARPELFDPPARIDQQALLRDHPMDRSAETISFHAPAGQRRRDQLRALWPPRGDSRAAPRHRSRRSARRPPRSSCPIRRRAGRAASPHSIALPRALAARSPTNRLTAPSCTRVRCHTSQAMEFTPPGRAAPARRSIREETVDESAVHGVVAQTDSSSASTREVRNVRSSSSFGSRPAGAAPGQLVRVRRDPDVRGRRVHVAQAAVEPAPRVDRAGAPGRVHEIDRLDRIGHGLRDGESIDRRAGPATGGRRGRRSPTCRRRLAHVRAAGADERLRLRHLGLDRRAPASCPSPAIHVPFFAPRCR